MAINETHDQDADNFDPGSWTQDEWRAVRLGELTEDARAWAVTIPNGEKWLVWKGLQEESERLYRSPTGRYYLGDTGCEPPYDLTDPEGSWRGRVFPGNDPGDSHEWRRHMAAHWFETQDMERPEDLEDVTPEQVDAIREEVDRRFQAFVREETAAGNWPLKE